MTLLARGANPNTCDLLDKSAFEIAQANKNVRLADLLVRFGAAVEGHGGDVRNQLLTALNQRDLDAVLKLASMFEGKKPLTEDGKTAFHRAASLGDIEMLRILRAAGLKPNEVDRQGNTALHLAAQAGKTQAYRWLVENGGFAEVKNHQGKTSAELMQEKS
jgi:ankyrin repeat protein